jgi:hypothetical protein
MHVAGTGAIQIYLPRKCSIFQLPIKRKVRHHFTSGCFKPTHALLPVEWGSDYPASKESLYLVY